MLCELLQHADGSYRCPVCGDTFTRPTRNVCKPTKPTKPDTSEAPEPQQCRHWLGVTDQTTRTKKGCGCKSATGMTALAMCELHGLVTFVGQARDASIRFCLKCPDKMI